MADQIQHTLEQLRGQPFDDDAINAIVACDFRGSPASADAIRSSYSRWIGCPIDEILLRRLQGSLAWYHEHLAQGQSVPPPADNMPFSGSEIVNIRSVQERATSVELATTVVTGRHAGARLMLWVASRTIPFVYRAAGFTRTGRNAKRPEDSLVDLCIEVSNLIPGWSGYSAFFLRNSVVTRRNRDIIGVRRDVGDPDEIDESAHFPSISF